VRSREQRNTELLDATLHRVFGPPGTGKTTYLSAQCKVAAEKFGGSGVVVGSLTKAAAAEVAGRDTGLPSTHVGTLHSHAYHALNRPAICETAVNLKDWNNYCGIASYRISGRFAVDPENAAPEGAIMDTDGSKLLGEIGILRQQMIPPEKWASNLQRFWKKWTEWKTEKGLVDFTDLIERAITDTESLPQKPLVFMLDEAQDMSKLEFTLAMHWGQACDQVVIVGDQDQNLYEWRGSDPKAFVADEAKSSKVLSQSYRVPAAVHAAAVEWIEQVPGREPISYEPRKDDDGRTVAGKLRRESHGFKDPTSLMKAAQADMDRGKTVMILTSCTYMLLPLIAELKGAGLPFWNPYRVKQGAWNPLRGAGRLLSFVKPAEPPKGEGEQWTWADVHKWIDPMQSKDILVRGSKTTVENKLVEDRFKQSRADDPAPWSEVLKLILPGEDLSQHERLTDLDVDWWESTLRHDDRKRAQYALTVARRTGFPALRSTPRLVVGTIHSVKGGEADVVYLLPDVSNAAYFQGWRKGGEYRSPILRQFYVGMTRAREELVLCQPSQAEAVKWL
jgi:DNA helicase-2/ATP-dependent DNA helicase PcrA